MLGSLRLASLLRLFAGKLNTGRPIGDSTFPFGWLQWRTNHFALLPCVVRTASSSRTVGYITQAYVPRRLTALSRSCVRESGKLYTGPLPESRPSHTRRYAGSSETAAACLSLVGRPRRGDACGGGPTGPRGGEATRDIAPSSGVIVCSPLSIAGKAPASAGVVLLDLVVVVLVPGPWWASPRVTPTKAS